MQLRQISEYVARARQMPPQVLAKKVAQMAWRKTRRSFSKGYHLSQGSFSDAPLRMSSGAFKNPSESFLEKEWPLLKQAVNQIMDHKFDLLGSGWVKVELDMKPQGVLGSQYPSNPEKLTEKKIRNGETLNSSNKKKSVQFLNSISSNYSLIDWQLDFKSGYRWKSSQWWEHIPYGHLPGVDIKVPWELSRMQHLPWLALAYQKTRDLKYFDEFRNQILDFMATNPPRFGVNWKCPMDVAIRAANWVLGYNLFKSLDLEFDPEFERWLANSLFDHGLFVEQNFEKGTDFRGNHYLADIAGLSFIAFSISGNQKVNHWRELCKKELLAEAHYQFHELGTNFEGSTAYHRLSSEMLYYPLLFVSLQPGEEDFIRTNENLLSQLVGMGEFAKDITKPDGNIVQIGDNDSGRFFKISPSFEVHNDQIQENHLNLEHLSRSIAAIFGQSPTCIESSLIAESFKAHEREFLGSMKNIVANHEKAVCKKIDTNTVFDKNSANQKKTYSFDLPGFQTNDLKSRFYKDFGLCIFKTSELFVSFRCGPVGQLGRGGHDHNDQLSIEVFYKGKSLISDPGTFLYTASPKHRNMYRSNKAHHCPQYVGKEMGDIEKALFFINNAAPGEVLNFDSLSVTGRCNGFSSPVYRSIMFSDGQLLVNDYFFSDDLVFDLNSASPLPYSPGYGISL